MLRWNLLPVLVLTLSLFAFPPAEAGERSSGEVALVSPLSHLGNGTGPGPGYFDASEFMMGSVAVGVFLVESTGSTRDWSDKEINETLEGIYAGFDWWVAQEPRARLSFSYELHIRASTSYEPTLGSLNDDYLWIDEILTDLGYTEPDPWSKALHFNNDLRERLATDWAFSLFVADSEDALNMGRFTNDQYAHAYFGGPWIAMSRFSSWAYNSPDYHRVVPAHEMGHIFYASDEYDTAPPMYSGYLNCPDNNGASGIMNRNTLTVSESTRCQIGWVDADDNGVLDILDVPPETTLTAYAPDPTDEIEIVYQGSATVVPLANQNPIGPRNDVTVSRITGVELQWDDALWSAAQATDGAFDNFEETFRAPVQPISSVEALPPYTTQAAFPLSATTPLGPGTHAIQARATDTEGNVDLTPATDTLTTTAWPIDRVELWYAREEGAAVLHGVDMEEPWSWAFDTAVVGGDGTYGFYTRSYDKAGNSEDPPVEVDTVTVVDTLAPLLTIVDLGSGWLVDADPQVEWRMEDATSGIASVSVRLDNGPWIDVDTNTSYTFREVPEGVHSVAVRATDRAGLSQEVTTELRLDRTPPLVAIHAPGSDAVVAAPAFSVAWDGIDATSGIARFEVRLDNGTPEDVGLNTSHVFSGVAEGNHTVYVSAYDLAGNRAEINVTFSVRADVLGLLLTGPFIWILVAGVIAGPLALILFRRRGRRC
jgi:hypothetical protein